jgi:DNA-binding protein HU-beta
MNNAELVETIAAANGVDRIKVAAVLSAFEEVVDGSVSKGENVVSSRFLSFERVECKSRSACNPRSGEALQIDGSKAPKVSIGSAFKRAVKGGDGTTGCGPGVERIVPKNG